VDGHIAVTFDANEKPYPALHCRAEVEVEPSTFQILEAGGFRPEWSARLRETFSRAKEELIDEWMSAYKDFLADKAWAIYEGCRCLAEVLRQFAPEFGIASSLTLRPVIRFSCDGETFHDSPFQTPERPDWDAAWLRHHSGPCHHARKAALPLFSEDELHSLRQLVRRGGKGFHSLKFLLRACSSLDPEMRWILAATAAELAVKEVLIRLVPKLDKLVEEGYGPSVDVYYGRLLEHYAAAESPKRIALKNGAARRNKLVHRTSRADELESEEVTKYVDDVRDAIVHLLTLSDELRPLSEAVARYRQTPLPAWSDDVRYPEEFDQFDPRRELERRLPGDLEVEVDYGPDHETVVARVWSAQPNPESSDYEILFERELSFEDCFDASAVSDLITGLPRIR
jgi:hypothetical protein